VPDGSDGTDVLDAAGHTLTVCRDGIIGEVDGRPDNGCDTKDSTHNWSYWHRKPGASTWTYATEGPATYQPANRSTEGWVWQDGGDENQPPPTTSYRSICPRTESPRPPSSSPPPTVGTEAHSHTAPTQPAPVPRPTATVSTPPPAPAPTGDDQGRHDGKSGKAKKTEASPSAAGSSTPTSAAPTTAATRVAEVDTDTGGGLPVGVIVAVAAVLALAGATVWQVRRQRDNP
jgi:hypothetical protein